MASSTKNVKLGVCQVIFDGVDLGYTQGGVEVSVKTDTHKVNVDQFGKTTINEYVMGREVTAKVPLAETTLDNMVAIMPGAVMTSTGGAAATGTITLTAVPANLDTFTLNGSVFTVKTAATGPLDIAVASLGGTVTTAAAALAAAWNASTDVGIAAASYASAAGVVTVTYGNQLIYGLTGQKAVEGNAFTLAKTGTGAAVSGATLTGGTDVTAKSVSVPTGIGTDLLSIAKELRFHPTGKAATDKSEDFVIPLAATAGALSFAYKLENERVYNVDFQGYPNAATSQLFTVGV